jgi:hypothetical protein
MVCQWLAFVLMIWRVPFEGRNVPGMLEGQWPYLFVGAYIPALALLLMPWRDRPTVNVAAPSSRA